MFVIKLMPNERFVVEISLDGHVFKSSFLDDAKRFDEPKRLKKYTEFLERDGYLVQVMYVSTHA
jgi:hypothetical protein